MSNIQILLALLILKAAPQDLPYSKTLPGLMAMFYVISGVLVLQTTMNPEAMMAGLLLGLFIQIAFIYLVFRSLNRGSRFVQTFCAVIGVGILFNLLSWPILSVLADEASTDSLQSTMSLLFLLLISWEVLVKAHIFKHALEMKMVSALALSFALFFISVALSQLLLPV